MRVILLILLFYPYFIFACVDDLERDIKEGIELRNLEEKHIPIIYSESTDIFIGRVLRIVEPEKNEKYSAEVEVLKTLKGLGKLENVKIFVSTKPDFNEKMINHGKAGCSDLYDKNDVYNSIYTFLRPGYKYLLYVKDGNLIRSNLFIESLDYISAEQEVLKITKER